MIMVNAIFTCILLHFCIYLMLSFFFIKDESSSDEINSIEDDEGVKSDIKPDLEESGDEFWLLACWARKYATIKHYSTHLLPDHTRAAYYAALIRK